MINRKIDNNKTAGKTSGKVLQKLNKSRFSQRASQHSKFKAKYHDPNATNKERLQAKIDARKAGFSIGKRGLGKVGAALKNSYATGNRTGESKDRIGKLAKNFDKYTQEAGKKIGLGTMSGSVARYKNVKANFDKARDLREKDLLEAEGQVGQTGTDINNVQDRTAYIEQKAKFGEKYNRRRGSNKYHSEAAVVSDMISAKDMIVTSSNGDINKSAAKTSINSADNIMKLMDESTSGKSGKTATEQYNMKLASSLTDDQVDNIKNVDDKAAITRMRQGRAKNQVQAKRQGLTTKSDHQIIQKNIENSYKTFDKKTNSYKNPNGGYEAVVAANRIEDSLNNLPPAEKHDKLKTINSTTKVQAREIARVIDKESKNNPNFKKSDKFKDLEKKLIAIENFSHATGQLLGIESSAAKSFVKSHSDYVKKEADSDKLGAAGKLKLRKKDEYGNDVVARDSEGKIMRNAAGQEIIEHVGLNYDKNITNKALIDHYHIVADKQRQNLINQGVSEDSVVDSQAAFARSQSGSILKDGREISQNQRIDKENFIGKSETRNQTDSVVFGNKKRKGNKKNKPDEEDPTNSDYINNNSDDDKR